MAGKPEALTAVQLTLTLPSGERHNLVMSNREAAFLAESISDVSLVATLANERRERAQVTPNEQIEKEIRAALEALPEDVLTALRAALKII